MSVLRRSLAVVGATVLVAATGTPAAAGKPLFNDHFSFTDSHIEQEEHGPEWCPNIDFPVLFTGEVKGSALAQVRGDGLVYFSDRVTFTDTYTNLENDRTATQIAALQFRDQDIVDNGDGTLTITVQGTGVSRYYGPDGEFLFRDVGLFRFQFVVDHNGTPGDPEDDEFLEDIGEIMLVGLHETADRDFCADLEEFLS